MSVPPTPTAEETTPLEEFRRPTSHLQREEAAEEEFRQLRRRGSRPPQTATPAPAKETS